jgi:EAL domain-containing protein (putative c-di-GMP-specific phosphodiesterase class I)
MNRSPEDLVLQLRPEVDLASGCVVAAEALTGGAGLGAAVGAAAGAAARLRTADPAFRVWFGASAYELDRLARLAGNGSLRGLGVSVTEDAAMRDAPRTIRALVALRAAGLAIALDDFGAGRSSLGQLHRFPVDVVKLDRAFAAGRPGDPRDREIVRAVARIGERLGFEILAKGVETAAEARALGEAGCRYGVGDHFGRPVRVGDLVGLVGRRRLVAS